MDPNLGPAQAPTALYRDYFADPANDVFNGEYADVLLPYAIPGTAHTPAEVRTLACNCPNQNVPTAFLLLHSDDVKLHAYVQLDRFDPRMGLPATQWDNRMFVAKGELHHNNQILVEWSRDYFSQSGNVRVPSSQLIETSYANDAAAVLLGPYQPNDADTEIIVTRRTCFIPPAYVPLFLANPLSPREAWAIVHTQIVNDNKAQMCAPLVDFLRSALTITQPNDPPTLAQVPPLAPLADHLLLDRRRRILEQDFPALNSNLATLQQNQIAAQLGRLVTEAQATRDEDNARRAVERAGKTPAQFLGVVGIMRLQRYCQIVNVRELPDFWASLSDAPKNQRLSILQWEINRVKQLVNEPDLQFVVLAPVLESIKGLLWEMATNDSITTGFNLFLLHEGPKEESLTKQSLYEMLHGDGASPTMSDAAALLKVKTGAPRFLYEARQQIRRFEIVVKIIMGQHHPLSTELNSFCNRMLSMETFLYNLQTEVQLLPLKICKKIAVQTSVWFKAQAASPTPVLVPNLCQMFDDMEMENPWEPKLTLPFLSSVGLSSLHTPFNGQNGSGPGPDNVAPNGGAAPVGGAPLDRNNNTRFNFGLFRVYKESQTACRTIRERIRNNALPALPVSKVDQQPMCLAWHTKGMCNSNCSRSPDHVEYSQAEYQPLLTWCQTHFPTE